MSPRECLKSQVVMFFEKYFFQTWISCIKSNCAIFCYTLAGHEVMVTGRIKKLVFGRDRFVAAAHFGIYVHHTDACSLGRFTLLL